MLAAQLPVQRPSDAKLLVVDEQHNLIHVPRSRFVDFLHPDDLVIANDAATLPASLSGVHQPTGRPIEVRLAGRPSLDPMDVTCFTAVVFGEGDFHIRTEDRPLPPPLHSGDTFVLGPLHAKVEKLLGHPRLVALRFEDTADEVWSGLASHGRPIQYSHLQSSLELWDVWTKIAGPPVAFEPPSAGFVLDWHVLSAIREHNARFATITHAAGISSTGDEDLDRLLPFDEPYHIPSSTAKAVELTRERGGRVIAVGTTVVRALEDAATEDGHLRSGDGVATGRIGPGTRLRVVDAILSGTHEQGTSHYELLRAFLEDSTLERATKELDARGYRTHEFGDSVLIL
ncbi:MAG TPA: S-adenosylmethionine:tRNA ribosyltransferase-isomerase [Pyrinomonadaceae bacterium]|jgi:S-adenosylmethionine:tRNA ribosyltransferase-isomerase|nr:S-adenosylmethionine:tRNA ribosyltransferase-isomerase [Pyrinomonadaceae bacterium]